MPGTELNTRRRAVSVEGGLGLRGALVAVPLGVFVATLGALGHRHVCCRQGWGLPQAGVGPAPGAGPLCRVLAPLC